VSPKYVDSVLDAGLELLLVGAKLLGGPDGPVLTDAGAPPLLIYGYAERTLEKESPKTVNT
jgi:hypothetical protein